MQSAISPTWIPRRAPVTTTGGIVAAQNTKAAAVGAAMLEAGGNAIDAAVATSFALAATEPWMSGLGGGGIMVIWIAAEKKFHAIDFGMIASRALDPADYPLGGNPAGDIVFGWPGVVEDRNLIGPHSMAVPGHVDGVGLALERFGTKPLREVINGAIRLADEGLSLDWYATLLIAIGARGLTRFAASKAMWLPQGLPPVPDWEKPIGSLALGNLGQTLRTIAAQGRRAFYEGPLADSIVADIAALGGRINRDDLARYHARIVEPLHVDHGNSTIATIGGLTAGPSLIRCLQRLQQLALRDPAAPSITPDSTTYGTYAEVLQNEYAQRLAMLGDSDEQKAPSCTSHISAIDRDGNMVAMTQTLVSVFGSKVVLPRTGVIMNNSMMTFDPRPGMPNSIGPGKRPLNNMCPIVAVKNQRAHFALGAAGGRRILPAVMQIADFLSRFSMPLDAAFDQPRIDSSGTDVVGVDPRMAETIRTDLAKQFKTVDAPRMIYPLTFACPTAVWQDEHGMRHGMSEEMQPWAGAAATSPPIRAT